ncbi:MAG: DUF1513 domain-containing protein [Phyllobacterium sp.]
MRTPYIDRRHFMKGVGAAFLATLAPERLYAAETADAVYATAYQKRNGEFGVAVLTDSGKIIHTVETPDRGHDVTFDPVTRRSVVFARRPGTFATIFDHRGREAPRTIASVEGRHFFGHGVFSQDGKLLYATENDFDNAAGMIGIYDARAGFRRIGEFPTYGMDPHELLLMPDGFTLAIANGGIETHPDYGRAKLNLSTMKPSLVFVDARNGDLVEEHVLPSDLHQLSIRHMAQDDGGQIWFGCQFEGSQNDLPLLVGSAERGSELKLLDMPEDILANFRNYIGSVAANTKAGTVAVSSPVGNVMAVIHVGTGKVTQTGLTEVCGLAPDGADYLATTGTGIVNAPDAHQLVIPDYAWDNHLLRIG